MVDGEISFFVHALGICGGLLFFGRFYIQWIASEFRRKSVMPIAFWYLSATGSLMLLSFAILTRSPIGTLGHNMNVVIYGRNLHHIWRDRGTLTKRRDRLLHAVMLVVVVIALGFLAQTWYREYEINQSAPPAEARQTWIWLGIGVMGQALFAARFLIQWIATERKRQSVVPVSFWYLSLAAAGLQAAAFAQRTEWVFVAGLVSTMFIYARNLYFIHSDSSRAKTLAPEG